MVRRVLPIVALVVLVCVLVVPSGSGVLGQERSERDPGFRGIDAEFARLAEEIPGFGGYFLDRDGELVVVLRDFSALAEFESVFGPATAVVGQFGFDQLEEWRSRLRPVVLGLVGTVSLDVDETRNRITVGIERGRGPGLVRAVEQVVEAAGVPLDAVIVEEREPIRYVTTLRDRVRPVIGGLQIRWSSFLCTLGFNAEHGGRPGFVTASHCSDRQGGVHRRWPTLYYQPLNQTADELIGTERIDPDYFRSRGRIGVCPKGYECRYSDSLWAEYVDPADSGGDFLARTEYSQFDVPGSLVLDDTEPDFEVTATVAGNTPAGTLVLKVGRTTGWTEGLVLETCVDVAVSGANTALLCQDLAAGAVGSGDSGSPVFLWDFLADADDVTLAGLLWGASASGDLFVYSPYGAVTMELGLDPVP